MIMNCLYPLPTIYERSISPFDLMRGYVVQVLSPERKTEYLKEIHYYSDRELVLVAMPYGRISILKLRNHNIDLDPNYKMLDAWRMREAGSDEMGTEFLWLRDEDFGIIVDSGLNCAATALRTVGLDIPQGYHVITHSARELLKILLGVKHKSELSSDFNTGVFRCVAFLVEQEFSKNPDKVLEFMQPGDIAYFIMRDSEGVESYHMGVYAIHPKTGGPTLFQTMCRFGPSGFGSPRALQFLYRNWITEEGEVQSSEIFEVYVLRSISGLSSLLLGKN